MPEPSWKNYERIAADLLKNLCATFNLVDVEGKQEIPGVSGASWEVDAKGIGQKGELWIIECRRYTTSRLAQEAIAGLALRVIDCQAAGGIAVSPGGLQSGAKIVAGYYGIKVVRLSADADAHEHVLRFLNEQHVGLASRTRTSDAVAYKIVGRHCIAESHALCDTPCCGCTCGHKTRLR